MIGVETLKEQNPGDSLYQNTICIYRIILQHDVNTSSSAMSFPYLCRLAGDEQMQALCTSLVTYIFKEEHLTD